MTARCSFKESSSLVNESVAKPLKLPDNDSYRDQQEYREHDEDRVHSYTFAETVTANAPGQPPCSSMTLSISDMRRMVSARAMTILW